MAEVNPNRHCEEMDQARRRMLGAFLVGMRLVAFTTEVSSSLMAQSGLFVAAVVPIARFLYLDRDPS